MSITKNEIFNYVMNDPSDTNPAVLRSMLDNISEGGGENMSFIEFNNISTNS